MRGLFRVVHCGQITEFTTKENNQCQKRTIVLRELGGQYENTFVVTLLGNEATVNYAPNDILYGVLRFVGWEYNGSYYQEVTVKELLPFK